MSSLEPIYRAVRSQQDGGPEVAASAAAAIEAVFQKSDAVILGMLFYGSRLRASSDAGKMVDLYVLIDSYEAFHESPLRRLASRLVPPDVFMLTTEDDLGRTVSIKYSVITLSAFERLSRGKLGTSIWGRFSQPVQVVKARDEETRTRILTALAQCMESFCLATEGLMGPSFTAREFCREGLAQCYRTELRAERPYARAEEIVASNPGWFERMVSSVYGSPDEDGQYRSPQGRRSRAARGWWFLRRLTGKPITVLRVIKGALTFEHAVDYALDKLEKHSGVRLHLTDAQRRRPLLWSPVLLWKAVRSGAWR
ncbi:hypothetical protein [Parvularcula maris]|uniref:Uncharacterized protein n=1 Tax=Parvularcula maris TaxID=2965077 RepID=A0A9X2LAZ5_9PROT|nr:hypothetical protein [Parvularcula maris]MCQ8186334.1 hypothetical protein [Parvularcula maris]